jgi:signal transduction histidine kinase
MTNLSHELRTPLNSIIGLSEAIAEGSDGPVNEDQVHHLSMIRQSGTRLLDTLNAMLDLSKIESNRLELEVKRFSLSRLISDVSTNVKLNGETKLVVDLKEQIPGVYGDEQRLRKVFGQLLDNAAKFTSQGNITVTASRAGEMLKVCVKDTGQGISREAQKQVFSGFCQADSGVARQHEGLGLGLTIARKIVELHGGRMWCRSKEGQGSQFYFTLPLKPTGVRHQETQ